MKTTLFKKLFIPLLILVGNVCIGQVWTSSPGVGLYLTYGTGTPYSCGTEEKVSVSVKSLDSSVFQIYVKRITGSFTSGSIQISEGSNCNSAFYTVPINGGANTYNITNVSHNVAAGNSKTFYVRVVQGTNTYISKGFTITATMPTGTPDLIINSGMSYNPSTSEPNGNVNVLSKVDNIGNSASNSSTTGVYFSNDNVLSGDDQLLNTVYVGSISSGMSSNQSNLSVIIPSNASSGTKYIIVKTDINNEINESNENNNTSYRSIVINNATPPSLQVDICFNTNQSSFNIGEILNGEIVVRNTPSAQSWSGIITVFLKNTISGSTYNLVSQNYTIDGGNSQFVYFNNIAMNFPSGVYKLYCQYSNAPNGSIDYIQNNGICSTSDNMSGTITPTKLISISQPQANLSANNPTISPNPIAQGATPTIFQNTIYNNGNGSYSGNVFMSLHNLNGDWVGDIAYETVTIQPNSSYTLIRPSTPIVSPPGTYIVITKYSNSNGTYTTLNTINNFVITSPSIFNLSANNANISPNPITQYVTPTTFQNTIFNTGNGSFNGLVFMNLETSTGTYVGSIVSQTVTISANSSYTLVRPSNPIQTNPGTYRVVTGYQNSNGNYITLNTTNLTINPVATCVNWTGNPATGDALTATEYLCSYQIINSQQNGTYNYDTDITRQDISKIAYLGLFKGITPNSPAFNYPVPFNDMQALNTNNAYWFNAAKVLSYLQFSDDITPFDRDFINFNPQNLIKRKYAIKMFLEAFDIPLSTNTSSPFTDVLPSDPMFKYIRTAYDLGIITGNTVNCSSGVCFHPEANIARQDAFIVLWRILSNNNITKPTLADLTDETNYFIPGNYRIENMNNVPSMDRANFNHYEKNVFSLPGKGIPLNFSFNYNSFLTELPNDFFTSTTLPNMHFLSLSKGWNHSYNNFIQFEPGYTYTENGNTITVNAKYYIFWADGSIQVYDKVLGAWETKGVHDNFLRIGNSIFITTKSQIVYQFTSGTGTDVYVPSKITDRNGNQIQYNYVAGSITPAVVSNIKDMTTNRQLNFTYIQVNGKDVIKTITETGLNRTVTFNYNSNGNLSSYVDPKGQTTYYNYDPIQNYNTINLLTEIILPKGNKINNTYFNRKLQTTKTFSQANVPTSTTSVSITPNYATGNIFNTTSVITDPQNRQTNYSHNTNGVATQIVAPTGTATFSNFGTGNNVNLPQNVVENGQSSSISYDTAGNVLSISKNGITNSFTYTAKNDVATHTDGNGFTTTNNYDANGNLISIVSPNSLGTTVFDRNSNGQVTKVTNPSQLYTEYFYNANGMVNNTKFMNNIQTFATYDNASRLITATDANGNVTTYEYDLNDNLTKTIDANNLPVIYTFDANDNNITIENQKNEIQTNSHNWDDDNLQGTTFGGITKNFTYYPDGLLHTVTKGSSTLTYTYDAQGRISSDGVNTYTYDSRNNIASLTNATYTVNIYYDINDRIHYYTRDGKSVYYTYDNNNNIKTIKYPNNNQIVEYNYDALNRMISVKDWNNNITTYTYHTDSRLDRVDYPNSTYALYVYDSGGRMTGLKNKRLDGSIISEYSYTLDNAGNHLTETTNDDFTLSSLVSLINTETINYPAMPNNKIQQANSTVSANRTFTHNNIGAIAQDGTVALTYNTLGQLTSTTGSPISALDDVSDFYDGLNNRVKKTDLLTSTYYWHDIQGTKNILYEKREGNPGLNYSFNFIYGADGLISRINESTNQTEYFHYDYRGSTTAITNASGVITHKYTYDPFGNLVITGVPGSSMNDINFFRYVGKHGVQFDGWRKYYMRARNYDPSIGRFISEDPIWHLNLYPYADNNPVMGIDPKGLKTELFGIGNHSTYMPWAAGNSSTNKSIDHKTLNVKTKTFNLFTPPQSFKTTPKMNVVIKNTQKNSYNNFSNKPKGNISKAFLLQQIYVEATLFILNLAFNSNVYSN